MTRRTLALVLFAATLSACGDDKSDPASKPTGKAGGAPSDQPGKGAPPAGGYGYAANLGADLDKRVGDAVQKGKQWLLSKRDAATGSWGKKDKADTTVGYTALATTALISATPKASVANDPTIAKSLDYVLAAQKPNGAIYGDGRVVNYETSAALGAFSEARIAKYGAAQAKAKDFLISTQIQGDESAPAYGGFPYKEGELDKPVDLSNLQFALDGLRAAGVPPDHAVFQRALKYLARVQNRSETNTLPVVVKEGGETKEVVSSNDGGGIYAPGYSKAGLVKRADGKWEAQSYGSMTYALLKCLLFAGVKADDPRVVAAVGWIQNHWALDRNPGFEQNENPAKAGQQGYFYYLRTMSRALAEFEKATGKPLEVKDRDGKTHAWRREVADKIASLQAADGSWVNDKAERWDEGNPVLATSYLLEALATCQGRLP